MHRSRSGAAEKILRPGSGQRRSVVRNRDGGQNKPLSPGQSDFECIEVIQMMDT
jgi:hypothetical protein